MPDKAGRQELSLLQMGKKMKYYLQELQESEEAARTAGGKAREDVDSILEEMGYTAIRYVDKLLESGSVLEALKYHKIKSETLAGLLEPVGEGDELVIQFPIVNNSIYHGKVLKKLKKKGAGIILVIHDLESLRYIKSSGLPLKKRIRLSIEEKSILKIADRIVVHNEKMKDAMAGLGYDISKMVPLGIFDYLIPEYETRKSETESRIKAGGPVIIAGNLKREKVGYIYELPENADFNLYGIGYEEQEAQNIEYKGAFAPEELPFALEGSFGLVWDGASAESCSGVYGEYLKINNPHKTSLYIASGIPVIIWKQAALADFVTENNCGIAVDSLYELHETLKKLTDGEYLKMAEDTRRMGNLLRNGCFLKKALD